MPFIEDPRITHNWYLRKNVIDAMRRHEMEGSLKSHPHIYIGDSKILYEIAAAFDNSLTDPIINFARVYARLSCTNPLSGKYHVVSLYQKEIFAGGVVKQVLEATWSPPSRAHLTKVTEEIHRVFAELSGINPKYQRSQPQIVGSLHEFCQ